ncbi:phage baseplate assembly protein [Oryzomicrobium sp.]|uniref:phage baseplate assembly protein n=1 Tax=Oryzomicrobium sp. TaxID=1911578 RepID=UPI002FE32C04
MPTPSDHKVQLLVGGQFHEDWESYEVDSDLLIPADAWRVTLGLRDGRLPPTVSEGAAVEVRVGSERVMTGRIDDLTHRVSKYEHSFSLSGRDKAADLVDCSAPIFSARQVTLGEIAAKLTREFGIAQPRIAADSTRIREKVSVEPGDTAWDALVNAAEANGLWPWFAPDGTLVIGGPDYSTPPVATLILRRDGKGNNVESLEEHRSIAERYSHLTVLGQTHGTSHEEGRNAIGATFKDTEMAAIAYRPKIVVDHESDNAGVAQDRARKLIADARLKGFMLTATVKGHRIVAPNQPSDGQLWSPGCRVQVLSEPHGLDGVFFLIGRRFTGGRQAGAQTELRLVRDGVWVLDAHPHKRLHRRGKNWIAPGGDSGGETQ